MEDKIIAELIVAGIAFVAWLIRLESKVMYLERDHEKHKESVKENEKLMWRKIEELQSDTKQVLLTLTRIEESLKYISKKDQKDQQEVL